jgi:hypothetical protein
MAKSVQERSVALTFRASAERVRILEAIQKIRGDSSRSETLNHALDVLFGGYKIKRPEDSRAKSLPMHGDV